MARPIRSMGSRPVAVFVAALTIALVSPVASPGQTLGENFEIGLSTDNIGIGSDFTGTDLVVFGALDTPENQARWTRRYDIVVALVGPPRSVRVRRKERTFGIWINRGSQTFVSVPASYALASTRPLRDIASRRLRDVLSIGVESLASREVSIDDETPSDAPPTPAQVPAPVQAQSASPPQDRAGERATGRAGADDPYAEALRRIRMRTDIYNERIGAVRFVSPTLFRADLSLPAELPVGRHEVRAYLFRDGEYIAQSTRRLDVDKIGFEALISRIAEEHALGYGLFAVLLAILTGWAGRIVFKRD